MGSSAAEPGIAHRINAERLVVLGWGRAILLQLAHPLVAAGVAGHSGFAASPGTVARRLHHTVGAMLSLTFGDEAAQLRTIDGIRAIHRRVNGRLDEAVGPYPAGTRYSAEDPDLVLWVHATLIESVVLAYDDLVAPLDEASRDAYCAQAHWVPLALGARGPDIPRTWADLAAWLDAVRGSGVIVVGPDAARVAGAVLSPPMAALVWPAAWLHRAWTIGTLPPEIQRQYGFQWSPRQARQLERTKRLLRAARRRAPRAIAWWARARRTPGRPDVAPRPDEVRDSGGIL